MKKQNRKSDRADANGLGVRENADRIRVLRSDADWNFPKRWKRLCLDVLKNYKEHRRKEQRYARLGWTKVRDEIMQPVDGRDHGGNLERDARLSRQDLEAWENGVDISDEKFKFIEIFIRRLELDEAYSELFRELRMELEKKKMNALGDLYVAGERRGEFLEHFRESIPKILVSEDLEGLWLKNILVHFQFEHDGILKVVFAYSPHRFEKLNYSNCADLIFYDGYVIPLLYSKRHSNPDLLILRCVIKLLRPEYKGNIGLGYADGEMRMTSVRLSNTGVAVGSGFILDYPNHILSPALDVVSPDLRTNEDLLSRSFSERSRHDEPLESFQALGPDIASGPRAYSPKNKSASPTGKSKDNYYSNSIINFRPAPEFQEKLSEIIQHCYKGYLF